MNVSIFCLALGVPGAARTVSSTFPGWPELWNLLVSLLVVSFLYVWVSRTKRQEAQRRREKVVPFPVRHALGLVALGLLAWAGTAHAQEPAPSPTPEPPKVDVTGFVDVYYGYNFNQTDPAFRTFDVQHNTFSLSLAEVAFAKTVSPESRVGFRVDLDFGKTADLVAAYEPEDNGQEIYKHIQQAYVSLLTGQGDLGHGQVRDPHRHRGHRVPGQLELHALDPLRLRDPLLPRWACGPPWPRATRCRSRATWSTGGTTAAS